MFKIRKIISFFPFLTRSFGFQLFIQLINLTSGILVVRMLSYKEYACYTIANTFIGMMTIISDGGITSNVMAQGGKVWNDKNALGNIFSTAYNLRIRFSLLSLLITLPFVFILLQKQNISFLYSFLIVLAIIPIFFSSLSDNLLQVPLKLHRQIFSIQRNTLFVSLARLLFLSMIIFFLPITFAILFVNGLTRIYGNVNLRKLNKNYITNNYKVDPEVRKILLKQMIRLLPGTIYFCFSGQIAIWLISIYGNNLSVASLGALGRFSLLFSIFTFLFGTVVAPHFSKIDGKKHLLKKHFMFIQICILFGVTIIYIIFYSFSNLFLSFLGGSYLNLNKEFSWSIAASLFGLIAGFSFSLFTARGWSMFPILPIVVNIFTLFVSIKIFQIHNLIGVLKMNTFVNIIQYLMNTLFCFHKIQKLN